jgi:PhnB protein
MQGTFMNSLLNPYLNFNGNTAHAMTFYETVFGGELKLSTFKDMGQSDAVTDDSKIMHSELRATNGIVLMAADAVGDNANEAGKNSSISLSGDNSEELTSYYTKLSEGGLIIQPLEAAPWGDAFGMVTDQFGVTWLVNISKKTK